MSANQGSATSSNSPSSSVLRAVAIGGLLVGLLDAADGVVHAFVTQGLNPIQVLQYIASGALGPAAFQGGLGAAGLGLLFHFLISYAAAIVFTVLWQSSEAVRRAWAFAGLAFGGLVWVAMNLVVLPHLSRVAVAPFTAAGVAHGLIGHGLTVGLTLVLVARRILGAEMNPSGTEAPASGR